MKITYEKGYDPGEDKDWDWTEIKEERVDSIIELISKMKEFIDKYPNAVIQGNCELEIGEFNDDCTEYTGIIFTTRD